MKKYEGIPPHMVVVHEPERPWTDAGELPLVQWHARELFHVVKHSPTGFSWGASAEVEFEVTVRAKQLEPFGVASNLGGIGAKSQLTASVPIPFVLLRGVSVMQVESGRATIVAAGAALAAELRDECRALGALAVPQALLGALAAELRVSLGQPGVVEDVIAVDASAFAFDLDGNAAMLLGPDQLAAGEAALAALAWTAAAPETVGAVWDAGSAVLTGQGRVRPHELTIRPGRDNDWEIVTSGRVAGSGPAELARCILIDVIGPAGKCVGCDGTGRIKVGGLGDGGRHFASCIDCSGEGYMLMPSCYQAFKEERIAPLKGDEGWVLEENDIVAWLGDRLARGEPVLRERVTA